MSLECMSTGFPVGSYSNAIPSSGFRADHDSKGITISRDYGDPDGKFLLTWAKVEKRIGELIAAGRYQAIFQLLIFYE